MFKRFIRSVVGAFKEMFIASENHQMDKEEIDTMLDVMTILSVNKAITFC